MATGRLFITLNGRRKKTDNDIVTDTTAYGSTPASKRASAHPAKHLEMSPCLTRA